MKCGATLHLVIGMYILKKYQNCDVHKDQTDFFSEEKEKYPVTDKTILHKVTLTHVTMQNIL